MFKGTEIQISKAVLYGRATGAQIAVDFQFANRDGVVHAHTQHTIEVSVTPKIQAAAKALLDALEEWGAHMHYEGVSPPEQKKATFRGLAESLEHAADPADDGEEQG